MLMQLNEEYMRPASWSLSLPRNLYMHLNARTLALKWTEQGQCAQPIMSREMLLSVVCMCVCVCRL